MAILQEGHLLVKVLMALIFIASSANLLVVVVVIVVVGGGGGGIVGRDKGRKDCRRASETLP